MAVCSHLFSLPDDEGMQRGGSPPEINDDLLRLVHIEDEGIVLTIVQDSVDLSLASYLVPILDEAQGGRVIRRLMMTVLSLVEMQSSVYSMKSLDLRQQPCGDPVLTMSSVETPPPILN